MGEWNSRRQLFGPEEYMHCTIRILASLSLFIGFSAAAAEQKPEAPSLAYVMAKRVAAMENNRDLPSRAVWLSNRVVNNYRSLAFVSSKKSDKNSKKQPVSQKN